MNIQIKSIPIFCKWSVSHSHDYKEIYIGCKKNTISGWDKWFKGSETFETKRNTKEFKQIYANYLAVKAYCKTMAK